MAEKQKTNARRKSAAGMRRGAKGGRAVSIGEAKLGASMIAGFFFSPLVAGLP